MRKNIPKINRGIILTFEKLFTKKKTSNIVKLLWLNAKNLLLKFFSKMSCFYLLEKKSRKCFSWYFVLLHSHLRIFSILFWVVCGDIFPFIRIEKCFGIPKLNFILVSIFASMEIYTVNSPRRTGVNTLI